MSLCGHGTAIVWIIPVPRTQIPISLIDQSEPRASLPRVLFGRRYLCLQPQLEVIMQNGGVIRRNRKAKMAHRIHLPQRSRTYRLTDSPDTPRSHACAASVFTLGCHIIRYLNPVISPGAFSAFFDKP
jgi:hypothetical protein